MNEHQIDRLAKLTQLLEFADTPSPGFDPALAADLEAKVLAEIETILAEIAAP